MGVTVSAHEQTLLALVTPCHFTPVFSVTKEVARCHYILMFWGYFICKIGKGVRKDPSRGLLNSFICLEKHSYIHADFNTDILNPSRGFKIRPGFSTTR